MANRGWFIFFLGGALIGIGLVALNFPVFIDAYDQWGWQIKCGNGYSANMMYAEMANQAFPQTNFVDQCQTALVVRRAWAIPVALVGWVLLSGLAVALWRHASPTGERADALT